jgi:hypothetical protein
LPFFSQAFTANFISPGWRFYGGLRARSPSPGFFPALKEMEVSNLVGNNCKACFSLSGP